MGGRQSVNRNFENSSQPISLTKSKFLPETASKSICRVEIENSIGFAGLYCFNEKNETYYVLITCENVLAPGQVQKAKFYIDGLDKFFKLPSDWIEQISFQPIGKDYFTVIVLKQAAINFLISKSAKFLKVTSPRIGDQVIIIQYSERKLSFWQGVIQEIEDFTLKYNATTANGIIGSPLLLSNGEAIGVHKEDEDFQQLKNQKIDPQRSATCLTEIIRYFLMDLQMKYEYDKFKVYLILQLVCKNTPKYAYTSIYLF